MRCQHCHFSIKPCRFSAYQGASFQVQVKKKFTKGLDKDGSTKITRTSLSGHSLLQLLHKSSTHWLVWNGILYFTDLEKNTVPTAATTRLETRFIYLIASRFAISTEVVTSQWKQIKMVKPVSLWDCLLSKHIYNMSKSNVYTWTAKKSSKQLGLRSTFQLGFSFGHDGHITSYNSLWHQW